MEGKPGRYSLCFQIGGNLLTYIDNRYNLRSYTKFLRSFIFVLLHPELNPYPELSSLFILKAWKVTFQALNLISSKV